VVDLFAKQDQNMFLFPASADFLALQAPMTSSVSSSFASKRLRQDAPAAAPASQSAVNSLRLANRVLPLALEIKALSFLGFDAFGSMAFLSKDTRALLGQFFAVSQDLPFDHSDTAAFSADPPLRADRAEVWSLLLHCERLQTLTLPGVVGDHAQHLSKLRSLVARVIRRNAASLQSVSISRESKLSSPLVLAALSTSANLNRFTVFPLATKPGMLNELVLDIAKKCRALTSLEIMDCSPGSTARTPCSLKGVFAVFSAQNRSWRLRR
jgi:hypothetical protein